MKHNAIALLITILVSGLISCSGQKENQGSKVRKGWKLVWEEEFDEAGDKAVWHKTPVGRLPMNKFMSHDDRLYVFQNGKIVLRGVKNVTPNDTLPFLTGGITIQGIKRKNVNRIEVKARINPAPGAMPFITLLPPDTLNNISIDIMHQYGVDDFVYQSVTSEYTTTYKMPDNPPSISLVKVNPREYHIYGVEKYADSLIFFVDDVPTRKYRRILTDIPGQFPFDDLDFDLFIGMHLKSEMDSSELPADLFIDWVRLYETAQVH